MRLHRFSMPLINFYDVKMADKFCFRVFPLPLLIHFRLCPPNTALTPPESMWATTRINSSESASISTKVKKEGKTLLFRVVVRYIRSTTRIKRVLNFHHCSLFLPF